MSSPALFTRAAPTLPVTLRDAGEADLPALNAVIRSAIATWDLSERVRRLVAGLYCYDGVDLASMRSRA